MSAKKTRAPKENKVVKYPVQIPIALDKKEQLQRLADEMDLSLAQYCRCVLLQHLKDNANIFSNIKTGEQPVNEEENSKEFIEEQSIDQEEVKKPKVKGFGAK